MLDKYIIAVEQSTPLENDHDVILITRDEYDVLKHEPLTGSDNLEEAQQLFESVKKLGALGYLDMVMKRTGVKI